MAAIIDDGGATKKAEDYFKWLAKKALEGAALLIPAGCAPPSEPEYVAIAISNGYSEGSQVRVVNGYYELVKRTKTYNEEQPDLPRREILEPFLFNKGDCWSLKSGLQEKSGGKGITDIFIFGHGGYVLVITSKPGAIVDPEFVTVGGLSGHYVRFAVRDCVKRPARVRIEACWQRLPTWESLNEPGLSFSSSPAYEEQKNRVSKGVEDMLRFAFTREGLEPGEYPDVPIRIER